MSEPTPETTPAPRPEPTGGPTAIGPTQRGAGKKAGWVRKRGWRRPHPRRKKKDPKPTTTSTKPNPRSGKTSTLTVIVKTTSQAKLIPALRPDWLVLRANEADQIRTQAPRLLTDAYSAVKVFDVSSRLAAYRWLPGRAYLRYDEKYVVFKRNKGPLP